MDHRIQVVCSELESYSAGSLRIADLSQAVNLSSSRLRHLFKSETGQTIAQYLRLVRLEEARVLLDTTFLSVKEVMHCVGFSSDSHFSHDFKEVNGLCPTKYRARKSRARSRQPDPL